MAQAHLTLEICVDSIGSAIAAEQAGADRIELCEDLDIGGLTPSAGFVAMAKQKIKVPIFMMIRPRCGSFYYTLEESMQMVKDIDIGLSMGADGFVTGALSPNDNMLDKSLCLQMIQAAKGKPVTFSRAFDLMDCDLETALNDVINLGFTRILTSGRAHSAPDGIANIKRLVELADSRIIIMPGAGINDKNIKGMVEETNAREYHSSGRFKKYEKNDTVPVVEGTDLYKPADLFIIGSMRQTLSDMIVPTPTPME